MASNSPSTTIPEPKSPGTQDVSTPTRPYLTITKLTLTLTTAILTIISATLWPVHTHPVFIFTLFTSIITFTILIYSHSRPVPTSPTKSHLVITFLLLHLLPFILWTVTCVLTVLRTHRYHTTTWRTGSFLDNERKYLAELPTGLTPANIASDYFQRYRTAKYRSIMRMMGSCAGLAGLMALTFVVSGVALLKGLRREGQSKEIGLPGGKPAGTDSGRGWFAVVLSKMRRKESLPVTENESKATTASNGSLPSGNRTYK